MTPSYALGLVFILLVSLIWSAASVVVQHLYRDMDFDSPFLLTYVSTALFVLWLPTRLLWERRSRIASWLCRTGDGYAAVDTDDCDGDGDGEGGGAEKERGGDGRIIPWRNDDNDGGPSDWGGGDVPLRHESPGVEMRRTDAAAAAADADAAAAAAYQAIGGGGGDAKGAGGPAASAGVAPARAGGGDGGRGGGSPRVGGAAATAGPTEAGGTTKRGPDGDPPVPSAAVSSSSSSLSESDRAAASPEARAIAPPPTGGGGRPPRRRRHHLLSHVDHISMAVRIAPVWFLSNYFYNTSLAYTSISSSTVLASTGSLFTFLFAVSCGDERAVPSKLLGVALCFAGSVLTGLGDAERDGGGGGASVANATDAIQPTAALDFAGPSPPNADGGGEYGGLQLWGDLAGLVSAVGYGTYTVLIRTLCPRDESRMSMQLLLGYIGGINGLILLPIAVKVILFDGCPVSADGEAPSYPPTAAPDPSPQARGGCEALTLVVVAYLLAKALIDNVLSDYLWARAVVLTSATVATVGLGLTIPLAFLSDWLLGRDDVASARSVAGALAVLFGFVFVNCGEGGGDSGDSGDSGGGGEEEDGGAVPALGM